MVNISLIFNDYINLFLLNEFFFMIKFISIIFYICKFNFLNFSIFIILYLIFGLFLLILLFFNKKFIHFFKKFLFNLSIFYFFVIVYCYNLSSFFPLYYLYYKLNWFGYILNIEYNIAIDNLSLIFLLLTSLLIPFCLLISWYNIYYSTKYFFLIFLVLEYLLINVFSAVDILFFYFSFEILLIPMYLLIGYWGARERKIHAAYLFFLFTFVGSLLLLIALLFCQSSFGSTNLLFLSNVFFSVYREAFIWILLFIVFL